MSRSHPYRIWPAQIAALAIPALLGFLSLPPRIGEAERAELTSHFAFERVRLTTPEPFPETPIWHGRANKNLAHVDGWVNSIGVAGALDDVDEDGLANDLCLSEARDGKVWVMPVPGTGERYRPFALDTGDWGPGTFPAMCRYADLNEDGLADIVVGWAGHGVQVHLRRADGEPPSAAAFVRQELVGPEERWYTIALGVNDIDGDGHQDLILGNYFVDGTRMYDPSSDAPCEMNDSMSRAFNGGRNRVYLGRGGTSGPAPTAKLVEADTGTPDRELRGWTLAIGTADLDGDALPELYFANDFGPDNLYLNRSTPGHLDLRRLEGRRSPMIPASKVLGNDSFKGMGVDFGDLNGDGVLDMFVSNLAAPYALVESHYLWMSWGGAAEMEAGIAPWDDLAEDLGVARSDWSWDTRLADFDNDGTLEAVQSVGFLQGDPDRSRWVEVQELAMANDTQQKLPWFWPDIGPGDDLSGHEPNPFYVRAADGRFYDLAADLGIDQGEPSRGLAQGDVDGDGDQDLIVLNQWTDSWLLRNDAPSPGASLTLRLLRPPAGTVRAVTRVEPGRTAGPEVGFPALGATVRATLPDGRTLTSLVDGSNGHVGARAPEVHLGLGAVSGPIEVRVDWRDGAGRHDTTFTVDPGVHTVLLEG